MSRGVVFPGARIVAELIGGTVVYLGMVAAALYTVGQAAGLLG